MKTILFCLVISFIFLKGHATDYYSQGSVSPTILSNWNVNPQGGGASPASFTIPGDRFIIQANHAMVTTATWNVGGTGSVIEIQNNGTLQGDHGILLNGSFQINDGGTYIHNNKTSVDETAGSSIFSGTELFAADSHFEIRNWPGKDAGLPNGYPGISWGDLIINLQSDISADGLPWNWNISDGTTLAIKGDLDIKATYVTVPSELRFTGTGIQTINVDGNLVMSGIHTKVSIKSSSSVPVDGYTTMQVNGNIIMSGSAQLQLGVNTTFPNPYGLYELRYKGSFYSNSATGVLYSSSRSAYLTANGNVAQDFFHLWNLGSNFRIAPGSTVNLTSALNLFGSDQMLVISGTLNQNGYHITVNGKIETAGGIFNSSGDLTLGGGCTACSNLNGIYNNNDNSWCATGGGPGRINFTNSSISLEPADTISFLTAGNPFINSPGEIYFVNSFAVSLAYASPVTEYSVRENSILSLDANSYIAGDFSLYKGIDGKLRIGSPEGITSTGNILQGNIRTALNKDYDHSGLNSFEYFGTSPQVTGNGLPATIDGTFKINNTAGLGTTGVTLSQQTTVKGTLDLTQGKLATTMSKMVILDQAASVNVPAWGASYVAGPVKKIGSTSFKFPIGNGNNYAPLTVSGPGFTSDEYIAEYFLADPGQTIGTSFDNPPVDHLTGSECWKVSRIIGTTAKNVTLEATAYTNAILLSELRVMRWDSLAWRNEGNTGYTGISAGEVTSNVVTDFFATGAPTPFTFGSINSGDDPLAINLLSFNAVKLSNSKAFLTWELAANCSANARFEIEKAGSNRNFVKIAVINGKENHRLYDYTDNELKNGINYYRLKMTENGTTNYSRIATIFSETKGLLLTSLIPVRVTSNALLNISSSATQKLELIITDVQGRVVQKQYLGVSAGNNNVHLSTGQLAAGVYQIYGITGDSKTNVIRFIKQ